VIPAVAMQGNPAILVDPPLDRCHLVEIRPQMLEQLLLTSYIYQDQLKQL